MTAFYQEDTPNASKRCKFLTSSLKDAFAKCHSFRGKPSISESEEPISDFDQEEEVFVSAVISKYMESKCKRKHTFAMDSFKWALSPETGDLMMMRQGSRGRGHGENTDEFYTACSRLSRCSSATSFEEFYSVKTHCLSRSSSLSKIEFRDFNKRSVLMEFCHCEGWPFGLCRKALLLPPLPNSPSDSWSWRKSRRMINIHV